MINRERETHPSFKGWEVFVATQLTRIGEKARKEPKLVFTSLYHHVTDVDNLRDCYHLLAANKAQGVDNIGKEEYGEQLEENLAKLSERLKRMGYVPQPKRRTYIPKPGSTKGRPLGISCFEDKIVELSMKRALEPIFEPLFSNSSYGYRPGLGQHKCIDTLGKVIQQKRVNWVVEADIKSFFDAVSHKWLVTFLRQRIGDERVLRLIVRMLKAGILEDGLTKATDEGTPQGSIISPLLSNVFLHYVLDLWFRVQIKKESRGEAYYIRFADDFLGCFQYESDARNFMRKLKDRLGNFGLNLAEDKTRTIKFGRFARQDAHAQGKQPETFDFLGFRFYCGVDKSGWFKVKRKTSSKKMILGLRKLAAWSKKEYKRLPKMEMIRRVKSKVQGHINYYAITDNKERCEAFVYMAERILFRWLSRKSQRGAYTWKGYRDVLRYVKWPRVKIKANVNPCGTLTVSI